MIFYTLREIILLISGAIGPIRDKLALTGLMKKIGPENLFLQTHEAVAFAEGQDAQKWSEEAIQTKYRR